MSERKRRPTPRNRSREALAKAAQRAIERGRRKEEDARAKRAWGERAAKERRALQAVVSTRLRELVGDAAGAFERRVGVPHGTLQGWQHAEKSYAGLPRLEMLAMLAAAEDVSLDWLVGRQVPRRLSEREPVGELAKALVDHVHREYLDRRTSHYHIQGIAQVLHAAPAPPIRLGIRTLQIENPQLFLADVCRWAFDCAEDLERHKTVDARDAILGEIERIQPLLEYLTEEIPDGGERERDANDRLWRALRNPLAAQSVRDLQLVSGDVHRAMAHCRRTRYRAPEAGPPVVSRPAASLDSDAAEALSAKDRATKRDSPRLAAAPTAVRPAPRKGKR